MYLKNVGNLTLFFRFEQAPDRRQIFTYDLLEGTLYIHLPQNYALKHAKLLFFFNTTKFNSYFS
jgi:hypothetical protein